MIFIHELQRTPFAETEVRTLQNYLENWTTYKESLKVKLGENHHLRNHLEEAIGTLQNLTEWLLLMGDVAKDTERV